MEWISYILIILILTGCILFLRFITSLWHNNIAHAEELNNKTQNDLSKIIQDLKKENDYLSKVKFADENIFQLIRCINIPQSPTCSSTNTGETVCRSKLIDCNKFKLVLLNDPIAVERMKVATDRFYQTNKPHNLSDLTYPVTNNWWFF